MFCPVRSLQQGNPVVAAWNRVPGSCPERFGDAEGPLYGPGLPPASTSPQFGITLGSDRFGMHPLTWLLHHAGRRHKGEDMTAIQRGLRT